MDAVNAKLIDLLRKYRTPILSEWEGRLAFSATDVLLDDWMGELTDWLAQLEDFLDGRFRQVPVPAVARPFDGCADTHAEHFVRFFESGEATIQTYLVWRAPEVLGWTSRDRVSAVRRMHEAFKVLIHSTLEAISKWSPVDCCSESNVSRRLVNVPEASSYCGRMLGPADFSPN